MNTETLDEIKIRLIARILKLDNIEHLRQIERTIDLSESRPAEEKLDDLKN